jgi:hypothetical protein
MARMNNRLWVQLRPTHPPSYTPYPLYIFTYFHIGVWAVARWVGGSLREAIRTVTQPEVTQ